MAAPHKAPYKVTTRYKATGRLWSLGWHTGDDWNTPRGTAVYAMTAGVVQSVSTNSSYGLNIIVKRDGVAETWSVNHLSKALVKTGQRVTIGQKIAQTGSSGNVTGPHDHVERRKAPYTFAAANFLDPAPLYALAAPKARPAWATLRAKKAPKQWYSATFRNLAGFDTVKGKATIGQRLTGLAADLTSDGDDVVGVVELPNGHVARFTSLMAARGYRHAAGGDGRHLYVAERHTVRRGGVFDLRPRYQGDDKQAAWAVVSIYGVDAAITCAHLEDAAAANDERVKTAQHLIDQVQDVSKGRSFELFLGDWNSDAWVRERAFNDAGYVDAAETAWGRIGFSLRTLTGWLTKNATATGARIDAAYVHRSRPVLGYRAYAGKSSASLSDHLRIRVKVGRIV